MLRLDDLGASSKQYEWWSRHRWANVWPLHHRKLFGAWGPYRELTAAELDALCGMAVHYEAPLMLAITAQWVEADGTQIPYSIKFPQHAGVVRRWVDRGRVTVAAHGLTHCQPGQHRPRWIGGNRRWHREHNDPPQAMRQLEADLRVRVRRYVAPGEIGVPKQMEVWHDRDLVVDQQWAEWTRACQRHSGRGMIWAERADPMGWPR